MTKTPTCSNCGETPDWHDYQGQCVEYLKAKLEVAERENIALRACVKAADQFIDNPSRIMSAQACYLEDWRVARSLV